MLQGFSWYLDADGRHWRRLAEDAQLFADNGITAVWLPPAYKGMAGANDVGYGVYDTYDLGEFDQKGSVRTKYGTREEYLAAIDAIHAAGMQAVADVALDHRMGADGTERVRATEVASYNREQPVSAPRDITAWTRFDFPGRGDKYSDFKWNWTCFHGVDYDEATHANAIYLFDGKHWSEQVDHHDNRNYDYLDDPDVVGWTREGDGRHGGSGVACVLTDRAGGAKRMYVGSRHAGERWVSVLGGESDACVGDDGCAEFACKGGSLSVYLPEDTAGVLENDIVRYGRDVPADLGAHLPSPTEEERREADRIRHDAERYSSSQASR